MTQTRVDVASLDDLSLGAVFLATGGGGDPYVSQLLAEQVLRDCGPLELTAPDALPDDAFVATIGAVGAPSVSLELLPSVREVLNALDAFEQHVGRTLDAVVSFEVGGGNSLIPIIAGAKRGIAVIDGDGMGRALPEAQMMTYPIAGIAPTPAVAVDYAGNIATLQTDTAVTYERHIRFLAQAMGGMITTVEHPMSGAELKSSVVPHTISFSIELGRTLRQTQGNALQVLQALQRCFAPTIYGEVFHLYTGKVLDYSSNIVGGYDVGRATIGTFDGEGEPLTLDIRNEYLVARVGDRILATVPDLITVLDYETARPVNAERLRFGQRVTVVAIGCPAYYREARALKVVAPRCFGFDLDYRPVESLSSAHRSE